MIRSFILIIICACLTISAVAARPASFGDLSSVQDRNRLIQLTILHDPEMLLRLNAFGVNVFDVARPVPEILRQLNIRPEQLARRSLSRIGVVSSEQDLRMPLEEIPVADRFESAIRAFQGKRLKSAKEMLDSMILPNGGIKRELLSFLTLYPLVYGPDGKPVRDVFDVSLVNDRIQRMSAADMSALYFTSQVSRAFNPRFSGPGYDSLLKLVPKGTEHGSFVRKVIEAQIATLLNQITNYTAARIKPVDTVMIALEELHPHEALYRASCGGDCSHGPLAYYALLENARVFRIWRNTRGSYAIGYVFTVNVNGTPLILAVSGPDVTQRVSEITVSLVSEAFGSESVYFPELDGPTQYLFDNANVKEIVRRAARLGTFSTISLPQFSQMERVLRRIFGNFENKYSAKALSAVYRVRAADLLFSFDKQMMIGGVVKESSLIPSVDQLTYHDPLTAALAGAQLAQSGENLDVASAMTNTPVDTIKLLMKFIEKDNPSVSAGDFVQLKTAFSLNWIDLKRFHVNVWKAVLKSALSHSPQFSSEEGFEKSYLAYQKVTGGDAELEQMYASGGRKGRCEALFSN